MRIMLKTLFIFMLIAFSWPVFAGKDPIAWTVDRNLSDSTLVGRTYTLHYTLTNQLPFQLVKALSITKDASPSNQFTYSDNCTGQKLASGASCTVDVTFTPTTSGFKTLQLSITGYDDNVVPLPQQTTTTTGGSVPPANTVYAVTNTSLPENIAIGTSYNYSFTFTNGTSSTLTGLSTSVSQTSGTETSVTDCGSTLASGQSCFVSGTYVPTAASPATQTVNATFSYTGGENVVGTTSSTVTSSPGIKVFFTGYNYLPAEMVGSATVSWPIQVQLFNNSDSTIDVTQQPTLTITTGGGSGTLTVDAAGANNNCFIGAKQVIKGQGCIITGSFKADTVVTATQVVVTGTFNYTGASGSPKTATTSTYIVPTLSTTRTISLQNNCDFPVWWSFHGSALTGHTCGSCPTGSTCGPKNQCFWNNPGPQTGSSYELAKSGDPGDSNTALITLNSGADPKIQWSGTISASLRCGESGTTACKIAPCDNSNGAAACAVGQGFDGPATQAEFTFNINTDDSYDMEVINGFHIPISITPGSHTVANNYVCGVPGNFTAENGFGSCNWQNAVLPSPGNASGGGYFIVLGGSGDTCNINSPSCAVNGEICGIQLAQNADNTLTTGVQQCGFFAGYWTADEVCGFNPAKGSAFDTYFQCLTPLTGSGYPSSSVYFDLMKCAVPTGDVTPLYNTCYMDYSGQSASAIATCCGCKDWWDVAGISANENTASCTPSGKATQTNPTWNSVMQNQVEWLKKACPSAYVYPFDDKTSGFSCTNNLPNESNTTNYTITFCAGNTGLPTGKTEGRVEPTP